MSDVPPLPESDDPFEVLGIPSSSSADEVRRAYTRLIRLHRPDRSPQAFQRVREAYEHARYLSSVPSWDEVPLPATEEAEPTEEVSPQAQPPEVEAAAPEPEPEPESQGDPIERCWQALAEGAPGAAEAALATAPTSEGSRVQAHRFLLDEVLGRDRSRRIDGILRAWDEGIPVVWWLRAVLEQEELHELVERDAFRWAVLRTHPDRAAAESMFELRLQMWLQAQRHEAVRDAICDPVVVDDAVDRPTLERVAMEIRCVFSWRWPKAAAELERAYDLGHARHDENWGLDAHAEAAREGSVSWQALARRPTTPRPFVVFFELWPVLDLPLLILAADALRSDLRRRSALYLRFLASLRDEAPDLLFHYIHAVQFLVGVSDPAFEEARTEAVRSLVAEGLRRGEGVSFARRVRRWARVAGMGAAAGFWLLALRSEGADAPRSVLLVASVGLGAITYLAGGYLAKRAQEKEQWAWMAQALRRRAAEWGLDIEAVLEAFRTPGASHAPLDEPSAYETRDLVHAAVHWTTRLASLGAPAVEEES